MYKSIKSMSETALIEEVNKLPNVRLVTVYAQGYNHIAVVEVQTEAKRGRKPKENAEENPDMTETPND